MTANSQPASPDEGFEGGLIESMPLLLGVYLLFPVCLIKERNGEQNISAYQLLFFQIWVTISPGYKSMFANLTWFYAF